VVQAGEKPAVLFTKKKAKSMTLPVELQKLYPHPKHLVRKKALFMDIAINRHLSGEADPFLTEIFLQKKYYTNPAFAGAVNTMLSTLEELFPPQEPTEAPPTGKEDDEEDSSIVIAVGS
jgi:hypothetical protein